MFQPLVFLSQKPIEEGKKTVKDKIDSFKNICAAFCSDNYQPQQFEKGKCDNVDTSNNLCLS